MFKIVIGLVMLCVVAMSEDIYDGCVLEVDEADYRFAGNTFVVYTVSVEELALIYSGKIKMWEDGVLINVLVRPFSDYTQKSMAVGLLGISPASFRESVSKNRHIRIVKTSIMLQELSRKVGTLGIVGDDELYMHTYNGLIQLRLK